jgi:hypothetical protein
MPAIPTLIITGTAVGLVFWLLRAFYHLAD